MDLKKITSVWSDAKQSFRLLTSPIKTRYLLHVTGKEEENREREKWRGREDLKKRQWSNAWLKKADKTEKQTNQPKHNLIHAASHSKITGDPCNPWSAQSHSSSLTVFTSPSTIFFLSIRMLFFRPRLDILVFVTILGWKYSCFMA